MLVPLFGTDKDNKTVQSNCCREGFPANIMGVDVPCSKYIASE